MRKLTIILVILLVTSLSVTVMAEFSVSLELYPQKMDNLLQNDGWLHNGNEWFATSVSFNKELFDGLTVGFNVKTYLFGTNGVSYAPSSVKYTDWVSYDLTDKLTVSYEHYCHHYFRQFQFGSSSIQDKISIEYSF